MKLKAIILILAVTLQFGCKKFVEVGNPNTQLQASVVYDNESNAIAAMLAIYATMEFDGVAYNMLLHCGLSADEHILANTGLDNVELANNNLNPINPIVYGHWTRFYKYIYQANDLLEQIDRSGNISAPVSQQLRGEAHFVRAFCNWYLTMLFGEIPLLATTDYRVTALQHRNSLTEVYASIEADLNEALSLLSDTYPGASNQATTERVRPIKAAANAMLARLKLYTQAWAQAESNATAVIANSTFGLVTDLNSVFLKNSKEAIWQWQASPSRLNAYPGYFQQSNAAPSFASLDTNFVRSFAANDARRTAWISNITVAGKTYHYPTKYKAGQSATTTTEYTMVLRLAEQYLIRAEARARQANLGGALTDLNLIRNRAGLTSLNGLTQQQIIDSVQSARRYELFAEFGDRWINLRRTGTANTVMPVVKGANWNATDILYPIPQVERNRNPNLTQNPGY